MGSVEANFLYNKAKDRLLHLHIARRLIEQVTGVTLPVGILEFQERLRNGVYLALLVRCLLKKSTVEIFDEDQGLYEKQGLHYKHVGNIQLFLKYLKCVSLPTIFHPEIPDVFEKKNISKLVYCLRALMHHVGFDLDNEANITYSIEMIDQVTTDLMRDEEFLNLHKFENSFVTADFSGFCELVRDLMADTLDLEGIKVEEVCLLYFEELREARVIKKQPLTTKEILEILRKQTCVYKVTTATVSHDKQFLLEILYDLELNICAEYIEKCMDNFALALKIKRANNFFNYLLTYADILDVVEEANRSDVH